MGQNADEKVDWVPKQDAEQQPAVEAQEQQDAKPGKGKAKGKKGSASADEARASLQR